MRGVSVLIAGCNSIDSSLSLKLKQPTINHGQANTREIRAQNTQFQADFSYPAKLSCVRWPRQRS